MSNNIACDNVALVLPLKREYVSTARLTASSVANRIGFNIDEIEDIKVAVSEVCNIILAREADEIGQYRISFNIRGNVLEIMFTGESIQFNCFKEALDNEYGLYIMKALMDTVELCNDNNSIVMTKKIGV
ncbi:ATP-binding protein [Ruminiclostridium cellobioparum]|jgi:serine/threonine-protein kinase RsbW|uniref:Anti-sigma regulatory factor (Ser/Thr protein kinase) n=1 Tax=Ruminiclostridium cellobioparum subsp. termitidis CT1112 TaxID=1195236 RepID=S0FR92_RUMCE|nr:ATP-binding protein [Ruminiclostridium cellobioparum]EMS71003.1 Anti-sigma regulatory factor (Ser/Thr protein kinase) [Ruminiclostridium cellobioparum subsp. termitidis CT1112]